MKKEDFQSHTRYTVTRRDGTGALRPANFYVFRVYDEFMIARATDASGLLHKIAYSDIVKIVRSTAVPPEHRFYIPDAVLKESVWRDRVHMERYSTSPDLGK